MPKITIVRPYEWANQTKNIKVYIDNEKVGAVGINETVHFEVTPGKHQVLLRSNWSGGSQPLELELLENEDKTLRMSSFKYIWISGLIGGFVGAFMKSFYIFLNKFFNLESTISFGVFFLLVIAILLSIVLLIFRKNTLKLEVVEGAKVYSQP